ncbi:MAG: response regulator transcription factor [Gammaproteobacteria bacterium]|nr:response regulator transcription factor [Gammaproteobacteria bacterium]
MHIAILDDDPQICEYVTIVLNEAGHSTEKFHTATEFKQVALNGSYDFFILDWELPDINGDEILIWLREQLDFNVPILFMTGHDTEQDIVKILQLGADDYMVKPFSDTEMLARIHAIARRTNFAEKPVKAFNINNLEIDFEERRVFAGGQECNLTPKEFDLLRLFTRNLGSLISKDDLLREIWHKNPDAIDTRTVDTHISRLRKKLSLDTDNGWDLKVVYQHGYRLSSLS